MELDGWQIDTKTSPGRGGTPGTRRPVRGDSGVLVLIPKASFVVSREEAKFCTSHAFSKEAKLGYDRRANGTWFVRRRVWTTTWNFIPIGLPYMKRLSGFPCLETCKAHNVFIPWWTATEDQLLFLYAYQLPLCTGNLVSKFLFPRDQMPPDDSLCVPTYKGKNMNKWLSMRFHEGYVQKLLITVSVPPSTVGWFIKAVCVPVESKFIADSWFRVSNQKFHSVQKFQSFPGSSVMESYNQWWNY